VLVGCAAHVSQDRATGPDGLIEGARPIAFAGDVARTTGTVSYPYGDRVDWFVVELPKSGSADVTLRLSPKRKGALFGLELWNDDYEPVSKRRTSAKRVRLFVDRAKFPRHKVYVRVYAVGVEDVGSYALSVDYEAPPLVPSFEAMAQLDIPDPPPLPRVPEPEPERLPPPPPPPCPDPPDPNVRACWKTCPPGSYFNKARQRCEELPECGDCVSPQPVVARVIGLQVQGDFTVITIGVGSDRGITKDWRGSLVDSSTPPKPIRGGELAVIRVNKLSTMAKVKATADQVHANPLVRLTPP
jgi:hypothetical protein